MKDNRGLSLVELVAVVAIMLILSTAVIGFVAAGMRHYQEARSEVNRQSEAQMVSNQLQDLLIDTANGVKYDDSSKELWAYTTEAESGSSIYTATKINWDRPTEKLLFSKYIYDPEGGGGYTQVEDGVDQLLAEHVSDFTADLSRLENENIITFAIEITIQEKSYHAESVVTLRNKLKEVADENEAFKDVVVELNPIVKNVVISPSSACMWQGGSYSGFTAVVNGVNYPAQDVSWKFSEATVAALTDAGTTIDSNSGMVTLGENETCESLTVVATSLESTKNQPDSSKWVSGNATVLNKYVTGIQMGTLENTANLSAEAKLSVNGVNFEGNEDLSGNISFEITDETGAEATDIRTSVRSAGQQVAGQKSEYILKVFATSDKYKGKTVHVRPSISFNGKTWKGAEQTVTFKERKITSLTLEMQDENANWMECGNTAYDGKRGEVLKFRVKVSYGSGDSLNTEFETYWLPGDSEWSEYLTWSVTKGGKETQDYGDVAELVNNGTFTLGDLERYNVANQYSFAINVGYKDAAGSASGQSIKISIPEVSISVLERHDGQSKEFMTNGESQNLHFVVSGLDASLYDITMESVEQSVMQQGNVRISGDLAILTPQKAGKADIKFNLVDKAGNMIQKGNKDINVTFPLEVGNKNLYVRTGGFGNYDYTLIESSMYVPVKNYSTKGTTAYSINGVKVEYRTTSGLFGTDKTVTINDGNKYTSVSHDGEQIWYR